MSAEAMDKHSVPLIPKLAAFVVLAILWPCMAMAEEAKPVEPAPANSCVVVRTIHGWTSIDQQTISLRTSPQKSYKVTFYGPCREANWGFAARVENFGMCLRAGDVLIFKVGSPWGRRGGFEERCVIKSIEALAPRAG